MIRGFAASVDRLIVVEELDPFIEDAVRLLGIPCEGQEHFPDHRRVRPASRARGAIKAGPTPRPAHVPLVDGETGPLPARPPVLCPGCPHRGAFYVLNKLKLPVNGDIGCYTLGLVPRSVRFIRAAAWGRASAWRTVQQRPAALSVTSQCSAILPFSTRAFPALINAAYNRAPIITIIMDNRVTGMTGHQENPGTGRTLQGNEAPVIDIEPLVRAWGSARQDTSPHTVVEIERTLKATSSSMSRPC
jgi:indolepyruvate ferredoxin oxidoreductase, alpha subunit